MWFHQVHVDDPDSPYTWSTSASPNFSTLPEVVWVRVMQMLDVADRYRVSLTCSELHDLLEHPSVWSSLIVNFRPPGFWSSPNGYGVFVTGHDQVSEKLRTVMTKFGEFIQHTRLRWFDRSLTSQAFNFVSDELTRSRRLKSATLEIFDQHLRDLFFSVDDWGDGRLSEFIRDFGVTRSPPVEVHIEAHISDSIHVNRPMFQTMFSCSRDDFRCRSVTVLHWNASFSDEYLSKELKVPAPTACLVSKLPCLQHFYLSVHYLSDQLLYELSEISQRSPLKTLNIHFHDSHDSACPVPKLSSEAWSTLALACPNLQVHCSCLYFRFSNSLDSVLKPETPVVSVRVEDSRPEASLRASCFSTDHADTLTTLQYEVVAGQHYLYGGQPIPGAVPRPGMVGDTSLLAVVAACPKLQHLIYKNIIHQSDVLRVAQIDRLWKTFQFIEDFIITDGGDDDAANIDDEKGQGAIPAIGKGALRKKSLDRLSHEVSESIGYSWLPTQQEEPTIEHNPSLYLHLM